MKIYIFSGAGISAPSGISTFRDEKKTQFFYFLILIPFYIPYLIYC